MLEVGVAMECSAANARLSVADGLLDDRTMTLPRSKQSMIYQGAVR